VKYIAFILSLLASPAFAGGDCATALVRFANQDAATYAESRCASEACQAAAVDDLTDLRHVRGTLAFGDEALTYPTAGIPLPAAARVGWSCPAGGLETGTARSWRRWP